MCGIAGIFNRFGESIDSELLRRMTAAIQHRGPDGAGEWINAEIGLGHRRLSIIDLGGGAQPMGNEDDTIQVVFNGEIYNYLELRDQLAKCGHQFKTRSDTEVIVHAYEQWGTKCVKRFNGMFAFALWDGSKHELFLARDHLGIKPLYYTCLGDTFLFGSEIKALLEHPACPRAVDMDSLAELFTFRYVPSPKTLFAQVMKLPPAHLMTVNSSGMKTERFWEWVPGPRRTGSEADLVEEYRHLLEDAVRLQMRSDVPLGLFLSSGIDSGVLLAIMRKYSSGSVRAFTIGFEGGEATNEIEDAAAMARDFGADHQYQMLTPDDYTGYYDRYMQDLEEPVGNETAAAFYFVSRITSREVKVALTGQGADEQWAGYDRYKGIKLSSLYRRLPSGLINTVAPLAAKMSGRMERLKRGVASLSEPDMLTRFAKVYSFFSAEMKAQLYKGVLKQSFDADAFGTRTALARLQSDVQHLDSLSQMLYIDTRASLPDDLLMVGDKTSMANSLEARVPFLDYRLVEFVESLPVNLKLRGFTGKHLHKIACEKWLPKQVIHRKKKGFANPIADWFRSRMQGFVEECLLGPQSSMGLYFDQQYIRRIIEEDRSGKQNWRRNIYLLVSLELWHRTFIKK